MNQQNRNYWLKRVGKFDEIYTSETTQVLNALEYYYKETYNEITRELAVLQAKYPRGINDLPSAKEVLLKDTLAKIDRQLTLLYENEANIIGNSLKSTYVSTYMMIDESLEKLGITVADMLPNAVEDAVRYNWSGATYSDRIWHQKDSLMFNMKETISKGLIQDSSYHEMAEELSKRMNVSYDACRNLVNTEVQAVQNRATLNNYENNEIEKYEVSAILDNKTCSHCDSHDGEIVEVVDGVMGTNLPPFHPSCRCTILPVIE